jgi:large subunit ribosomal protein L31
MKAGIHPKYEVIKATCSCGNIMEVRSTLGKDINLDVCSLCHPFYTGKQRNVDTGGRVDRFKKRFGAISKK